jgi:hypothetical protein
MGKLWMPKTAGILDIVAGGLSIAAIILVYLGVTLFRSAMPFEDIPEWLPVIIMFIGVPRLLIDILAVVGGICCLKRKAWGLALAGSIAAVFSRFILGVAALVFVIWGKDQFK